MQLTEKKPMYAALLTLVAGAIYLSQTVSTVQAALWIVGGLLGVSLYFASFGFTQAWRVFVADRKAAGLRAQMIMLAIGVLLFFPFLAQGSLFGQNVVGNVSPPGLSVVIGAFIFGIGMQLGGGCASGTLFAVGGGNTRMIVTLLFFIIGSVIGAYTFGWWSTLPSFPPYSVVKTWGLWPALIGNLAVFALIFWATSFAEKKRHGKLESITDVEGNKASLLRGPWPLVWGAVALVALNFITFALSGKPWGITSAFALWGSKFLYAFDVDVTQWAFYAKTPSIITNPVTRDVTSVMDVGIMLGAVVAACAAGKFAPIWHLPLKSLLAAIIGGLMLGFGARLAFGCNIGAYFSGIISGSAHAWLWLVCAFAGSAVGVRVRPWFDLVVEKTPKLTGC
jgi:hypothetical protein